jgi:tRNA A-37 threonylcarbamoyl transferase component Bud32
LLVVPDGQPHPTARVLAGRYRLVEVLAVGGMATVWEGYDQVLSRPVAIKVPHPHLAADPSYEARFRREAVAAARLSHPGIVATYDTGHDAGTSFIVMELVRGHTLRDLVKGGPVQPSLAVAVVAQIAEALDVAHRAGLIHRDVKPANLLVVDEGGPVPRIKVADFGVARAQDVLDRELTTGEATREGFVVGTARYLAPEQVAARALDARTDVYALGCVLYELLAGQPPFVRETDLGTALAHLQDAPAALPATVPAGLRTLVADCLAKDPDSRPPSAADLVDRLAAIAGSTAGAPAATSADVASAAAPDATTLVPQMTMAMPVVGAPAAAPAAPAPVDRRPVAGTRPTSRPSRSNAPLVVVLVLVLLAGIVTLAVLAGLGRGSRVDRVVTATTQTSARAASVASVRAFDPDGDRTENDGALRRLIDGDPKTSWSTDRYHGPRFGGLKPGVGVVLELGSRTSVGSVSLRSSTKGYAVSVYAADEPAASLQGWGAPLAQKTDLDGNQTVSFDSRPAGALLLWFTDPGATFQLTIDEISLQAP